MTEPAGIAFALASPNLADLLRQAQARLMDHAQHHTTQRGGTASVNNVALTWQAPQELGEGARWSGTEVDWYLNSFVSQPAVLDRLVEHAATLLFPYTYFARSRRWDGGWADFATVLHAIHEADIDIAAAASSLAAFSAMVSVLGEQIHVQTVLSLLALYPLTQMRIYGEQPELATAQAQTWRTDMLQAAIADIGANPHSRRAVVGPLLYPHLERQLEPQMGKPPYQLFQFLPGDPDAPLSSIHEHRSLDVVGGAQLDFAHDHLWLRTACQQLGREMGNITVIAHNLHSYHDPAGHLASEGIEAWLCRVTDGYRSGQGIPRTLLRQPDYAANVARIYERWRQG